MKSFRFLMCQLESMDLKLDLRRQRNYIAAMSNEPNALLQYFNQVLGIREILVPIVPVAEIQPDVEVNSVSSSVVLFIDDQPWNAQAQSLFEKICEAMKLESGSVQVLFAVNESRPSLHLKSLASIATVVFSKKIASEFKGENIFAISSPNEMLNNPSLKKQAWADLQKVMLAVHSSSKADQALRQN